MGFNTQHQKIYQALNIPFPQKYVNFKFYRLNQQEKNHKQLTWKAQTNEVKASKLILEFVILFKTVFVLTVSANRNTNILFV